MLVIGTIFFIAYKLLVTYKFSQLLRTFSNLHNNIKWELLVLVLILMFLNIFLEVLKWQKLLLKFETFTLSDAFKSILSGIALSIITPNQLGDFAGRVMHLKVFSKIKGSLSAVIGHTSQMFVSTFLGSIGFCYILLLKEQITSGQFFLIIITLIILAVAFMFFYVRIGVLSVLFNKINFLKKYHQYYSVFTEYNIQELMLVMFLSVIRYGVFVLQYLLLAKFFQVDLSVFIILVCIVSTYFVQSVVPSFLLLDIGLRGASALWFFGMFVNQYVEVLLVTYSLWIINIMIPAMFGLWHVYKLKLEK